LIEKFLSVKVKTRSRVDAVQTLADGSILMSVKAAPLNGKANAAVVKLLAAHLQLPRSALEIKAGSTSNSKLIKITQ
jgi:uncharacterized protein